VPTLTSFLNSVYCVPESSVPSPAPADEVIEILIADELTLVREGLALLCDSFPGFHVIAQVGSAERALTQIRELEPAIALLDSELSDFAATEVIRRLGELGLKTRCAVLSVRTDRKTVFEALRSGACGYILRNSTTEQMADALIQLCEGEVYISPQIGTLPLFSEPTAIKDPLERLSRREFQVYTLLVEGVRCKEIAGRLGLSPKTIDTYKTSLMRKLEVDSMAALVRLAESYKEPKAHPALASRTTFC